MRESMLLGLLDGVAVEDGYPIDCVIVSSPTVAKEKTLGYS
jgi:hypothetical protein